MSIATEITRLQSAKADIKSAIEEKGVEVGDGTIDTYAEKIGEISVGGGEDFLKYCTTVQFADLNLFGKEDVTLNLDNTTKLTEFYYSPSKEPKPPQNTTVKHLTINCHTKLTDLKQAFDRKYKEDLTLEHLTLNIDTSEATSAYYFVSGLKVLKVIDGQPLNFSKMTNVTSVLSNTTVLEEIRFVENSIPLSINFSSCPKLSNDTIQSIIDGLADLTGGTTQTLTVHQTVYQKIIDNRWDVDITDKKWALVKA